MAERKVTPELEKEFPKLYESGLGTWKIAKSFGLGTTTVRNYLVRNCVKFRPDSKSKISKKLEEQFVKLYKDGQSIKQIAEICNSSFFAVRNHLYRHGIKLRPRGKKKNIPENADTLTPEKAYILGVVGPGDGFIEFNSNSQQICLEAVDRDFIEHFAFCLEKVYGIKPSIKLLKPRPTDTKPHYKVRLYSVEACRDLVKYNVCFRESKWQIPEVIKKSSMRLIGEYIKGMADSQGSVNVRAKHITLCNKNTRGLEEIGNLLNKLDIPDWHIYDIGLTITSHRSLNKFYENAGFIIERKQEKLEKLLESYKIFRLPRREIARLIPVVFKLYENSLTPREISDKTDLASSTIYRYFRKFKENEDMCQIEFLGIKK